jgi:tetratricopeptide (TPR) repeat protein
LLDEAWGLIEPELHTRPHDPDVLRTAAFIAQARHAFDYAVELTRDALALDRSDDQAWLLLASIHLVQGRASEAERACRALRRVPPLVAATCHARVAVARSEIEPARSRLSALLAIVEPGSIPVQWYAWALSVAGDLAAAAHDAVAAAACYERSLALVESTQVRAALVDTLLELRRLDRALEILDAGPPALPLTVRRLIVTTRLGSLTSSDEIVRIDREFGRWIAAEDWLHAREMARFYLDVVERRALARRLALINLTLQREPEDIWLERRTRS